MRETTKYQQIVEMQKRHDMLNRNLRRVSKTRVAHRCDLRHGHRHGHLFCKAGRKKKNMEGKMRREGVCESRVGVEFLTTQAKERFGYERGFQNAVSIMVHMLVVLSSCNFISFAEQI